MNYVLGKVHGLEVKGLFETCTKQNVLTTKKYLTEHVRGAFFEQNIFEIAKISSSKHQREKFGLCGSLVNEGSGPEPRLWSRERNPRVGGCLVPTKLYVKLFCWTQLGSN